MGRNSSFNPAPPLFTARNVLCRGTCNPFCDSYLDQVPDQTPIALCEREFILYDRFPKVRRHRDGLPSQLRRLTPHTRPAKSCLFGRMESQRMAYRDKNLILAILRLRRTAQDG